MKLLEPTSHSFHSFIYGSSYQATRFDYYSMINMLCSFIRGASLASEIASMQACFDLLFFFRISELPGPSCFSQFVNVPVAFLRFCQEFINQHSFKFRMKN